LENGNDEIPLGYMYDYGRVAKTYKPSEDIKINIEEDSILHNDQMIDM
jgi:ABC-type Fe3+ transport system substrate-binding protein